MAPVLNIINANKNFDGTVALDDFSLEVSKSSITGIIGPNGAGKTTLFNVITGFLSPDSGKIIYGGRDLNRLSPYRITRLGLVRTFQQLRLITRISVLDNRGADPRASQEHQGACTLRLREAQSGPVPCSGARRQNKVLDEVSAAILGGVAAENIMLSFQGQSGEHLKGIFLFPGRIREQEGRNREKALELLRHMGIEDKAHALVEDLSYGQQKMVSAACCLASGADLLLLDEPVVGINPEIIDKILAIIKRLPEEGKTVVLIEHNIDAVMQVCDKVVFMDEGRKIVEGDPESVRNNPAVLEAYLE